MPMDLTRYGSDLFIISDQDGNRISVRLAKDKPLSEMEIPSVEVGPFSITELKSPE